MSDIEFYEQLDNVFDDLFNIYGFNETLIDAKSKIIKFYIKDDNSNEIVKQMRKKYFKINELGKIISVN